MDRLDRLRRLLRGGLRRRYAMHPSELVPGPEDREAWWRRPGDPTRRASFRAGTRADAGTGRERPNYFQAYLHVMSPARWEFDHGDPFERMAAGVHRVTGESPVHFSFENVQTAYGDGPSDPFGITGTGHAPEVIRKATRLLSAALHRYAPPVVFWTAAEPSRARLYERVGAVMSAHHPDYHLLALDHPGYAGAFAAVRREYAAALAGLAGRHGLGVRDIGHAADGA